MFTLKMPLQNAQGRLRRFVRIQNSIEKGARRFVKQPGIASTDPSARTRQVSRSQHLINKVELSSSHAHSWAGQQWVSEACRQALARRSFWRGLEMRELDADLFAVGEDA